MHLVLVPNINNRLNNRSYRSEKCDVVMGRYGKDSDARSDSESPSLRCTISIPRIASAC